MLHTKNSSNYRNNLLMKKIILLSIVLMVLLSLNKKENTIDLTGRWENQYGSKMELVQKDIVPQKYGTQYLGSYSSTTGSTGVYETSLEISESKSDLTPLGFAIYWSSIDGSTQDPSAYWTTLMNGYIDIKSSPLQMQVINFISAPSPLADVQILEPGVYPQSLTFTKKDEPPPTIVDELTLPNIDQVKGVWIVGGNDIGLVEFEIKGIDRETVDIQINQKNQSGENEEYHPLGKIANIVEENNIQSFSCTWTTKDGTNYGITGLFYIDTGVGDFVISIVNQSSTNALGSVNFYKNF